MSGHMPPVPPANRSPKGSPTSKALSDEPTEKKSEPVNSSEQGETANIKQNTTNKGFFKGRRMK
jgi:hypothetical protein